MDSLEAIKAVYNRIQKLEPEYVGKIVGYIFLQDNGEREMIRLAMGPDNSIHNMIQKAKTELGLASKLVVSPPISPSMNPAPVSDFPFHFPPFSSASPPTFSSPATIRVPGRCWDPQLAAEELMHNPDFVTPFAFSDSIPEDYRFRNQPPFVGFEEQLEPVNAGLSGFQSDYYHPDAAFENLNGIQQSSNLSGFPVKACHYFNKGFCKHGSNCRYFHGQSFPESYPYMFATNSSEFANEDHVFSPGSLEKLETEITELLKPKRGPVSIASLPLMYFEKYGKTLQADGYLTESQRHGKAGYSLTKLLARLKNSIRLIERPHGQHSVILVEDASKYMENRTERNDPGPIVSGSRQIYLTFPAESTFTEHDVASYFSTFGPVQDVRIPCQQKRMFGFVTFDSADTVKIILAKGNPHFVCGARVLVKPYREKSKLVDRKFSEKVEHPMYYHSHQMDTDFELPARWPSSRLLRKQLIEEQERALELERMRLSQLQLARKPLVNQSYFGYSTEELKVTDEMKFPSAENFNYLLDVLKNSGSTSDDTIKNTHSNNIEQDSSPGLNLPDSPFASPIGSSISTVS